MKFDVSLLVHDLGQMPALARFADELGFDGIWTFGLRTNLSYRSRSRRSIAVD